MTLAARCPSCKTAFKIPDSLLQKQNGLVRCANCSHVFNAYEHAIDLNKVIRTVQKPKPSPLSMLGQAPSFEKPEKTEKPEKPERFEKTENIDKNKSDDFDLAKAVKSFSADIQQEKNSEDSTDSDYIHASHRERKLAELEDLQNKPPQKPNFGDAQIQNFSSQADELKKALAELEAFKNPEQSIQKNSEKKSQNNIEKNIEKNINNIDDDIDNKLDQESTQTLTQKSDQNIQNKNIEEAKPNINSSINSSINLEAGLETNQKLSQKTSALHDISEQIMEKVSGLVYGVEGFFNRRKQINKEKIMGARPQKTLDLVLDDWQIAQKKHMQNMLLASLFFLLMLVGTLFFQRNQIVANMPSTMPFFAKACGILKCDIKPLEVDNNPVISYSDMQKDMSLASNRYIMNIGLKNKEALSVAMPFLEISLFDLNEQLIARRIFHPQEFLRADDWQRVEKQGMAQQEELPIKIRFQIQQAVSSFKVTVFYP